MKKVALLVAALAALATAAVAQAAPPGGGGPPDPVHGFAYEEVVLGQQRTNQQGQPIGPPETVSANEHRPDQIDTAAAQRPGRINPRIQAVPGCYNAWAQRNGRSPLGFLLYTFRHTAHFCWNSTNTITSLTRSVQPSAVDPIWHYGGLNSSTGWWYVWCCGRSNTGHYGMRRGYFYSQIFPGAPITGRNYPRVEIWVHGNGTWTYTTSAS
jgi:hypothetical protein